ncbi:MAG: hypothetical protein ACYDA3_03240 [Gaiellaceae bacterium]
MTKVAALLSCLCVALGAAGASSASPGIGSGPFSIGVTEDAPKGYDDGGLSMYKTMLGFDLSVDRMSVDWDPTQPTTVLEQASLARAIAAATVGGVKVVLSIQPAHNTDVTGTGAYAAFAAYCVLVAKAFPQVQDFIIGNEPNKQLFNSPSWNGTQPIGAYNYEHMLATAYDALHAFNPNVDVIGLALAPRGSDPTATSNVGIPPVIFIDGVAAQYKAEARSIPIADNVSLHPYPNPSSADDPPEKGYQWPNAGVPNLDRLEQAWWDGFNGTAQPLFEEDGPHYTAAGKSFVKWLLDEAGWQVPTTLPGYFNTENWKTVSESVQAQYYASIVSRYACDPKRVASLLFFHWIDEKDRAGGFQSGFARIDNSIRDAAASVKSAFAAGCPSAATVWQHLTGVAGASADFTSKNGFLFFTRAEEDATYTAGVYKSGAAAPPPKKKKPKNRGLAASRLGAPIATTSGMTKAYFQTGIKFPGKKLPPGRYVYSVTLKAAYNPARTVTFTSAAFTRK